MTAVESKTSRWPIVELLALAAPTVGQMASYTLMQFTDRWMLSRVADGGDLMATAAGTAGLSYFSVLGFGFGTLLVLNTLASQSFGRKDFSATGQYLWQGIWFGLSFGLVTLALLPLGENLFLAMGHEHRIAVLETEYLRVLAYAGWAKLVTIALSQFLLGVQRPTIVLVGTLTGILGNLFFNWLLIYGNWGFPAMGVAGSAWGTNASVGLELLVMAAYVARPAFVKMFNTADWMIRRDMMRMLLKIGLPAGFQLVCDIMAWTVFLNVIVGHFGTAALSGNSFAFSYMHICFMPAVGVGGAVTALVGKYIGMGRHDLAARRAHLGFFVCAIYMVLAGAALYLFRYELIGLFTQDPKVLEIGAAIMFFVAIYQLCDAMFLIYVGALRGAGDTLVPAIVQAALVWTIVVGGGAVIAWNWPQYGVSGPWTLATVFGVILGLFLLNRFQRGHWKSIVLHPESDSNVPVESAKLTPVMDP